MTKDQEIALMNSRNIAVELMKMVKQDVPFVSEKDALDMHERITRALFDRYENWNKDEIKPEAKQRLGAMIGAMMENNGVTGKNIEKMESTSAPKATPTEPILNTDPKIKEFVDADIEKASTKEELESVKAKILASTKISLTDQAFFIGRINKKMDKAK